MDGKKIITAAEAAAAARAPGVSSSGIPGPLQERFIADVDSYKPNPITPYAVFIDGHWREMRGVLHTWTVRSSPDTELSQASEKTGYYMQSWVNRDEQSWLQSLRRARGTLEGVFGFDIVGDEDKWSENWGRK